jgi:hypothetical protein
MLAEKELQGRQPARFKSSFTPRQTSMTPSTSCAPAIAHFSMTPSTSRAPSTSTTPPPAPHASEMTPPAPHAAAKPSSSTTSTSRTSDIKCHRCHGVDHFQHDCPSKKSYIATDDGGYVSASDVEDDFALQTNNAGDLNDDDAEVFGSEHTEEYSTKTYVVQRALSAQVDTLEKLQCHNLFKIFFVIKDCRVRTIIDRGSCNNLVCADVMAKIGLRTRLHTHPYYIQWLNNSGKAKVTHTSRVHFSIGTYHDYANCDVVPMQACSLLLGHPWEFDIDAIHHGRSNKYTLVQNGKKITLLPLTQNEIVQCDRAITETTRRESEIQHASPIKLEQRAPSSRSNAIKLKSHAMLATKSDIVVSTNVDISFHALVCRQVLFSLEDITTSLPHAITNLLYEFKDVFPAEIPPGLPPLRGIEPQIDLFPGASLPNQAAYRTNLEETKEIQRQVQELLDNGYVGESLSPCIVPVILVPKNGTWCLCVDCQAINNITIRYRFPIPRLDDMLDELSGSTIFTKIDL